jgi:hypothetical protein
MAKTTTWMPLTAGILDIICGAWGLFFSILLMFIGRIIVAVAKLPPAIGPISAFMAIIFALLAILAIIGGVYALKRKIWGLALAGSIAALFSPYFWLLAITSIVLTAMSKKEFD